MGEYEVYFDESESPAEKIICVAGYVFEASKARALEQKWTEVLERFGVRYFHMVECAGNSKGFAHLTPQQCSEIGILLMDLLKEHMECGFAVNFDTRFAADLPSALTSGIRKMTPYDVCCSFCLHHVRGWMQKNNIQGSVSYFFEAGHASQKQAARILRDQFSTPELRALYKHRSHAFRDKRDAVLLQCADILAWQWRKYLLDKVRGKTAMRKDLISLLEKPHFQTDFNRRVIRRYLEVVIRNDPRLAKPLISYQFRLSLNGSVSALPSASRYPVVPKIVG